MLNGKQRAELRALAAALDTIVHVGKGGITDNVAAQMSGALEARELVKGRVLENSGLSAREACEALAERCRAEPVQVIGSRFVLYRKKPEVMKPPARPAAGKPRSNTSSAALGKPRSNTSSAALGKPRSNASSAAVGRPKSNTSSTATGKPRPNIPSAAAGKSSEKRTGKRYRQDAPSDRRDAPSGTARARNSIPRRKK